MTNLDSITKSTIFILIVGLLLVLFSCFYSGQVEAELASYVEEQDEVYDWHLEEMVEREDGSTLYLIRLISQEWQDYTFEHRLALIIPEEIKMADFVGLFVGGGSLAHKEEDIFDVEAEEIELLAQVANEVHSPMAVLFDVPYQPLFDNLREDALISYTFDKFLETKDPEWPLLLPMTATVVRAMDCLEEVGTQFYNVDDMEFLVFGGSKRGWTTWLTAAVDSRVAGIGPAVYDNLGLEKQMEHQLKVWGAYSPQISDYTERGLELETPAGQKLIDLVDPYSYIDDITVPKLIMIATNDPYWPLDALDLYYDGLKGPVNLLYVPNVGHGMGDWERILNTYGVFHHQTARGLTLPSISDNLSQTEEDKILTVSSGFMPAEEIRLWQAESPQRDFREAEWEIVETKKQIGSAEFNIEQPEDKWKAVMAEVVYSKPVEFSLTTRVHLWQD